MSVKKVLGFLIVLVSSLGFFLATAEEPSQVSKEDEFAPIAGYNYEMIVPPQPTESKGKIEVVEVFWYGCPHCYHFEPILEKWLESKPDDVEFKRMPGVFRRSWVPHAKAYYAAQKLGILDKIHRPLFDAIHEYNKKLFSDEAVLDFITELDDVDGDAFRKAFNAYSTESKVKQAMRLSRAYGIRGVPSMIINGKYWTSGSLAGSYEEMLKVVDALVDKERKKAAGK